MDCEIPDDAPSSCDLVSLCIGRLYLPACAWLLTNFPAPLASNIPGYHSLLLHLQGRALVGLPAMCKPIHTTQHGKRRENYACVVWSQVSNRPHGTQL